MSKRDRLAEALWIQLSALGVLSSNPLVETSSPFGRAEDCSLLKERAVGDLVFSSREAEIIGGLKRLATVSLIPRLLPSNLIYFSFLLSRLRPISL